MTEAEWLASNDPERMVDALLGQDRRRSGWWSRFAARPKPVAPAEARASLRKHWLYACACCRRLWPLLTDERSRGAVESSEQAADGLLDAKAMTTALAGAEEALGTILATPSHPAVSVSFVDTHALAARAAVELIQGSCLEAVATVVRAATEVVTHWPTATWAAEAVGATARQAMLRDIFGNPFRRLAFNPALLTATVTTLAQAVYEERAFDLLPILADALEEAGCTNADILQHCRQPGDHVRGCWVVDLLLNKE